MTRRRLHPRLPGADPAKENKIDVAGWNAAYGEVFNTAANPVKTARSTVGVAALVNADWLIEIEAFAVYPAGQSGRATGAQNKRRDRVRCRPSLAAVACSVFEIPFQPPSSAARGQLALPRATTGACRLIRETVLSRTSLVNS